jgi:hypothetical protein
LKEREEKEMLFAFTVNSSSQTPFGTSLVDDSSILLLLKNYMLYGTGGVVEVKPRSHQRTDFLWNDWPKPCVEKNGTHLLQTSLIGRRFSLEQ